MHATMGVNHGLCKDRGTAYMAIKHRRQVHTGHEHIITHVIVTLGRGRAKIRRHGNVGCTRHVANDPQGLFL